MLVRALILVIAVVALWLPLPVRAADKIETGFVGAPTLTSWPWYVGMRRGFFADVGIEIDPVYVPSAPGMVQQLSAGSLGMISGTGLTDPLYAIDKGAPIAVVRVTSQASPYVMVSKPEIKSIKELKGKTIVIGGLTDITRVYFDRMMAGNGLKTGDYDITVIGATPGRYAALKSGSVDATLLLPPILFQATAAGFNDIGTAYDYAKDLPFGGWIVNRTWAAAPGHTEALKRLLPAFNKSLAWLLDDANRADAIAVLQKEGNLQEQEVVNSYNFFRKLDIFEKTGKLSRKQLGSLMAVLVQMGELQKPIPMEKIGLDGVSQIGD